MFGFAIGTLCALGLLATRRMHAHHAHHHHWSRRRRQARCDAPLGARRRRARGPNARARVFAEMLKRRLDVDDDQALVVDHAVRDAKEAVQELTETLADARLEVADALRGEVVDEAALDALFERGDQAVARARRHLVSAVKQVHAVLDEEQRHDVAEAVAGWTHDGRF